MQSSDLACCLVPVLLVYIYENFPVSFVFYETVLTRDDYLDGQLDVKSRHGGIVMYYNRVSRSESTLLACSCNLGLKLIQCRYIIVM